MGSRGGGGHIKFFNVTRSNMDDLIDDLECPLNQQESGVGNKRAIVLVQFRVDDRVRDASFIFDGKEDEAVSRAGHSKAWRALLQTRLA